MAEQHITPADVYRLASDDLQRYCSYQERTSAAVMVRLARYEGLSSLQRTRIVQFLIKENYLSDRRYLEAFVHGKFSSRKWGKMKILQALQAKKIDSVDMEQVHALIPADAYAATLRKLIEKKATQLKELPPASRQQKIIRYVLQKGYLYQEIMEALQQLGLRYGDECN